MAVEDFRDLIRGQLAAAAQKSDAVLMFMVKVLVAPRDRTEHVGADNGIPARFTLRIGAGPVEEKAADKHGLRWQRHCWCRVMSSHRKTSAVRAGTPL